MSTLDVATTAGGGTPCRPRVRRWWRAGASLALVAVLLALVDLPGLARVVATAAPALLAAMLGLFVAERLFSTYRWLVLLRIVEPGVRYGPLLRVTMISNFFGTFLPSSVGIEILRVYGLSRHLADLPLALSSVLLERLCGLLALVMWLGIGLVLAPIGLPFAVDVIAAASLTVLIATSIALLHAWPRRIAGVWLSAAGLETLRHRLVGLERRLDAYGRRPWALLWSLVLAFVFQFLRIVTMAIGARALGIDVDPILFAVIVPVTVLITLVPISIGGFGPRQASYVVLLGLAGVAPEPALVLGLAREALNFAASLPGALLYAMDPQRTSGKKVST